jgi:5-(carboxyamino)imidazole ribonucleotide synthase
MKELKPQVKVGILGGGQLARMLALQGLKLGLDVHVLSARSDDPAAQVVRHWTQGNVESSADLKKFFGKVEIATFESEFLNVDLLSKATPRGRLEPKPKLMGLLQDRLTQKQLLAEHKIPTADFMAVETEADLLKAWSLFDGRLILKKRRFGYDGYGTFKLTHPSEVSKLVKLIENEPSGFIAEALIDFDRELAFMIARSRSSDIATLPLVETHQENSRCLWVKGPSRNPKAKQLMKRFAHVLKKIDYVGVMGVELFETAKGLMVNELAPRVHNSAHYSLDALGCDQFTLHWLCLLGQNLPKTAALRAPGFAMWNLLGSCEREPSWNLGDENLNFHWYGKSENRPGRKMGHLTALGSTPEKALASIRKSRKSFAL